jgi:hypothetical protein
MYLPPVSGMSPGGSEPEGDSYGAIVIAVGDQPSDNVAQTLRGIRFSGWIAPPHGGWHVVLGDPGAGVVASGRRGVIEVAALLAESSPTVLAVRVRRDRQLAIVAWRAAIEVGRYCSDPSQDHDDDGDVVPDPLGAEYAARFAAACERAEVAEALEEVLAEELDTESVFESERLRTVLRMLRLPSWLVAIGALPSDIPTGPRARELTRLRAGASGMAGVVRGGVVARLRRRRRPPPVIADPPRSTMSGFEPWML